jgi:hypothetical protein
MRTRLWLALVLLFGAGCAAPAPLTEEPRGPWRVLILGDSISIGYTPHVRKQLADSAMVVRPTNKNGGAENCEGTNKGVQHIDRWLALEGGDWDVIHFNFGLHDLKRIDPETGKGSNNPDDPYQASPERYEAQLREIVRSLQKTGAHLIFATTTPVPTGVRPYRAPEDAVEYNRIAVGVMEKAGIEVNDLYGLALPYLATLQQPENVHFTKDGSYALSLAVVQSVGRKRVVASSQGSSR